MIEFDDRGGATLVTATEYGWPEGQLQELSRTGMEQRLAKLETGVRPLRRGLRPAARKGRR